MFAANSPTLPVILKTGLAFVLALGLLAAPPARAAALRPIVSSEATPNVTLDTPGLYDLATVYPGTTVTIAADGIGLTGSNNWLRVVIGAGVTLTLKDAHIVTSPQNYSAITAGGMGCGLVLVGDNSADSSSNTSMPGAGLNVPDTASLVIDGPGKLTVSSSDKPNDPIRGGAGIGGDQSESSGPITIRNATIVATGNSAGIGGGSSGNGSGIVIVNSSVTANGGLSSAGIGGGSGIGSNIVIIASAVKAVGGGDHVGGGGAGIGGGAGNGGKNIRIDAASVVQAVGGAGNSDHLGGGGGGGAGIGGGGGTNDNGVDGGAASDIHINSTLAAGSSGGLGGSGSNSNNVIGGAGGKGALCGRGGGTGTSNAATVPGGQGTDGEEIGGCTVDSSKDIDVALANHPNRAYAGDSRRGYPPYRPSPAITKDPSNAAPTANGNARFSMAASGGTSALAYQWQVSPDGGVTWTDIADGGIYSGATTRTLTLTGAAITDSGKQYRCVVNDVIWQEAASSAATLMLPLALANDPSMLRYLGLSYFSADWELACDNTRTCRAAGYSRDQDELPVSVLLTRNAGPNEAVTGQLMIGQYGDNPVLDSLPAVFDLSWRINGKAAGQIKIPGSRETDLTPPQIKALLAALVRTSDIVLTDGSHDWRLSDAGAAAVLLKMDEFQGRVGTPGALVRKGKKNEASVLAPLPIPVVKAAPLHKPLPGDELFVEKNKATLLEALRAISAGDDDNCDYEAITLKATRLTETRMLISGQCWMAAYNSGDGYWVVNSTPPWQPILVTDLGGGYAGDDISGGVISSSQKGRGLGDCWSMDAWMWDGQQFVHTRSATTGMCKLIAPGGAWNLPTIVTKVPD